VKNEEKGSSTSRKRRNTAVSIVHKDEALDARQTPQQLAGTASTAGEKDIIKLFKKAERICNKNGIGKKPE
jgi:hypothetical protein